MASMLGGMTRRAKQRDVSIICGIEIGGGNGRGGSVGRRMARFTERTTANADVAVSPCETKDGVQKLQFWRIQSKQIASNRLNVHEGVRAMGLRYLNPSRESFADGLLLMLQVLPSPELNVPRARQDTGMLK